jgi:hypothetical protein
MRQREVASHDHDDNSILIIAKRFIFYFWILVHRITYNTQFLFLYRRTPLLQKYWVPVAEEIQFTTDEENYEKDESKNELKEIDASSNNKKAHQRDQNPDTCYSFIGKLTCLYSRGSTPNFSVLVKTLNVEM